MDKYSPRCTFTSTYTAHVPSVYPQDTELGSTESHWNSI